MLEATGLGFADALSGGTAASALDGAVLLTAGSNQATATSAYLGSHPALTRYALGGPAAAADPSAIAIVGVDRYDTSAKVAAAFFNGPTAMGAASGANFPDALSGGAHAGAKHAPLVLVPPSGPLTDSVGAYLVAHAGTIAAGYLYGGPAAVGDDVLGELQQAITAATPATAMHPTKTGSVDALLLLLVLGSGLGVTAAAGAPRRNASRGRRRGRRPARRGR